MPAKVGPCLPLGTPRSKRQTCLRKKSASRFLYWRVFGLAVAVGLRHYHMWPGNPLVGFPFTIDKPPNGEMNDDDDEIQADVPNQSTQMERDEAFCARMLKAIEAGLESAPIGVVTTPGTKNPKYVPTEPRPLASSQRDLEHA